jgi:hypothetical protein
MNTTARARKNRLRLTLLVACGLVFAVPPAIAKPAAQVSRNPHGTVWEEWQPLAAGYIARRRVPERLQLPANQRRSPETQVRATPRRVQNSRDPLSLWLYTGSPGLYAVGLNDLAAETGIDVHQLRGAASKKLLGCLNGGADVSWYYDKNHDRVLFAGEAYETFYTETNAYQLQQTNTPNAQYMTEGGNARARVTGLETPSREQLHFEQEGDMMYAVWLYPSDPNGRYWFWDYLYGSAKPQIQIPLRVPNPAGHGTAHIRIRLDGFTDLYPGNDHYVSADLNGHTVGSVLTWDGLNPAELVADFDQAWLDANGDNILTLHSTQGGQFLESIDVEYDRLPVAEDGQLWMHDVAQGAQEVTGFTGSDIVVIESPVRNAVLRTDINVYPDGNGGWAVAFNAKSGSDYLVAQTSALLTPVLDASEQADLAASGNRANYLIIAPREFSGPAQAMAEYRRARYSSVETVWLDDIYKTFSFGHVDPFAIGRFMTDVRTHWATVPSVVTLVGKGSLDRKNVMGYGDNFLPVVMTSNPWALAASDARLLGVEDGVAPFAYGRLPITNDAEGLAYLDKLLTHESQSGSAVTYGAVVTADNPDIGGDFWADADGLAAQLAGLGFAPVTKLEYPTQNVRAGLIQSGTWESGFVSYTGHGSTAQIGDYNENFLNTTDAAALNNTRQSVFAALTCAAGDDSMPGTRSLAGVLVLNPQGGAIAALAPTGLSVDADADVLGHAFIDNLYGEHSTVGDALAEAKQQTSGQIADFMAPIYSVTGDPAADAQ